MIIVIQPEVKVTAVTARMGNTQFSTKRNEK